MIRRLGDITEDLEPLIFELVEGHDMQWGEILNLIKGYLEIHCPGAQEEYEDGTRPIMYYGSYEGGPGKWDSTGNPDGN